MHNNSLVKRIYTWSLLQVFNWYSQVTLTHLGQLISLQLNEKLNLDCVDLIPLKLQNDLGKTDMKKLHVLLNHTHY